MSQTVRRLLGQNLLVYFENYLEVHVKVYVKIVYSWFSWNQKGRKQSRDCWVGTCSCTSRAISRCTSRCTSRLSTAGSAGILNVANSQETVGSEPARGLRELSRGARQGVRQGCLQLVSWNQKGRKQSRDCWVATCSCTSRAISRCTSRCMSRLSTAGLAGIQKVANS